MAIAYQVQNSFNGGQIGESIQQRFDDPKYTSALRRLENMVVSTQGPITRRAGTRLVANAKNPTDDIRFIPFVFNADQAFVIELGDRYVRFFKDGAQVFVDGLPLDVATPYLQAEIRDVDYAQAGDTIFLSHPLHPPAELVRFADDNWTYQATDFAPGPSQEFGFQPDTIVSLTATTGAGIAIGTASPAFLETDVDRLVVQIDGPGSAVITSVTSDVLVGADVINPFTTTTYGSGEWGLDGSPRADLSPDKATPIGSKIVVSALLEKPLGENLISNGSFDLGLDDWTSYSPVVLATGTTNPDTSNLVQLIDTTKEFLNLGVVPNHQVRNLTDNSQGDVLSVGTTSGGVNNTIFTTGMIGGDGDFDIGDSYTIEDGSAVVVTNGIASLRGALAGTAWMEQSITTVAGQTYRVTFDVLNTPISAQVGTAPQTSDLFSVATFLVGNEVELSFVATSELSYVQFRNNQNLVAQIDNVEARTFSADTFRTTDIGKLLKLSNGIVEITSVPDPTKIFGIIRKTLTDDNDVLAGAWSIEEPVWTSTRGFPAKVTLFQQRLVFMGSTDNPLDIWGSVTGDFFNFSSGVNDGDSYRFTLTSQEVNQVQWMSGANEILIGTQREEFSIAGGGGRALTPTNVIVRSPTRYGSVAIQPQRVGNATIFIQRDGRVVRELIFSDSVEDLEAADLTVFADDITLSGVIDLTYQQFPQPTLWAVRADGTLLSAAYLRRQRVIGWAVHPTQGTVKAVTVIPAGGEDQVWIAVERFGRTFIEFLDTQGGHYGQLTLDSAVSSSGAATTTATGLSHLVGQTVRVLGDGANFGTFTVNNFGSISGFPIPAAQIDVGLDFTSVVETLRPIIFGANGGASPTIAKPVDNTRIVIRLLRSGEGFTVQGDRAPLRIPPNPMSLVHPLFTGDYQHDGGSNGNDEATIIIVQDLPLPLSIQSVTRFTDVGET